MNDTAFKFKIRHDEKLTNDLSGINADVTKAGFVDKAVQDGVAKTINKILDTFITREFRGQVVGEMSGTKYKLFTSYDSDLSRATRSSNAGERHYAKLIRKALDDALERTITGRSTQAAVDFVLKNPKTRSQKAYTDFLNARKEYRNMLIIADTVSGSGEYAAKGLVMPNALRAAVNEDKLSYAMGSSELDLLARHGEVVLTPPKRMTGWESAGTHGIPAITAGTIGTLAGGPLTGAATGTLAALSPGLVGRMVNSKKGQQYLKRQPGPPVISSTPYRISAALRGAAIGAQQQDERRKRRYGGTSE